MSTAPSWKHSGGQPNNRPAPSRKSWQPGQTPAGKKPASPTGRYRRRVIAAGVSLFILIGLIIALIWLWDPTKPPALVVVAPAAPESTAAPYNAAAGAADLLGDFRPKDKVPHALHDPDPAATVADWFKNIDPDSKDSLVLHFACPGAADKDGPFLWFVPADAPAAEPAHRLKVSTVLSYLKALKRQPPVLLILDAATEPAAWARGQLHNDFARQLKKLDKEIKDVPNLVVICSADDDQRSWVSEERRQTAFAHYLREGLRGVGTPSSARLTAAGLFGYVHKGVSDWAQKNRDAKQEPFLLPTQDADAARSGPARAEKLVLVSLVPDNVQPTALPTETAYPEALTAEWKRAAALADRSPPPEATAPHLWRQYLDLLLQADRAARSTRTGPAPAVTGRLATLGTALTDKPWTPEPTCVPYALPAATALWDPRPTISVKEIQTLLAAPTTDDQLKDWTALANRVSPGAATRPTVRLAAAEALLKYLTEGEGTPDKATLDKASALLQLVDGGAARPVESHLVHMFKLHLKDRNPDLVRRALSLQIAAERAAWFSGDGKVYPHAEQVVLWFGPTLQTYDDRRRELIDLVFAGNVTDLPGTGTPDVPTVTLADALDANRKEFDALAAHAAKLGEAYRLRDRVLTRLPYYARWAAARRDARPEDAAKTKQLLDQIEAIAGLAHLLTDKLETPTPGDTEAVLKLAADLREGFARVVRTFDEHCEEMPDGAVPSNWHAIDAALEVPFIAPTRRAELLAKGRTISRRLEAEGSASGGGTSLVAPQAMAQRQGRMAVAVLGRRGFGARSTGLTKDEVSSLIAQPDRSAWWESLTTAGAEIGAAFTAIPQQAADAAKKGSQRAPESATEELRRAAALARLTDGATELRDINPVAVERRYWTHLLLVGQAVRTAADGWADVKAGAGYSATAAKEYLATAETVLFSGSPVPAAEREKWKAKIPRSLPEPRFALGTRPGFSVTNQPDEKLSYTVAPAGGAAGYPVLKVHGITPPLNPGKLARGTYETYVPVGRFPPKEAGPKTNDIVLGVGTAQDGTKGGVHLDLLFRGWVESRTVVAEYAGIPTYEWIYRPVTGPGAIAVRGDDILRDGSVAILLDASESMSYPKEGESKYVKTCKALQQMLEKLPPKTMVSLHYFAGLEGRDGRLTLELKPTPWNQPKVQAKQLYDRIISRTLDGQATPISTAISTALKSEDVFVKTASGHRSLIVLTDGAEHDLPTEDRRKPTPGPGKKVIAAVQLAHKIRDIAVHLMLVGVPADELESARIQFGAIEERGQYDPSKTPPVLWPRLNPDKTVNELKETKQLVAVLLESMFPKVSVRLRGKEMGRLPVSIPPHWFWLKLNVDAEADRSYELFLAQTRRSRQIVQLAPGERMILKLIRTPGGLEFSLPSYADVRDGMTGLDRNLPTGGRIVMTVPRKFLIGRGSDHDLELTATLESPLTGDRAREDGLLLRERPRFVWFDVLPRGAADPNQKPRRLRIENLPYRWAPAWRVTAGPWVARAGETDVGGAAAPPTVHGYWLDTEAPATSKIVLPTAATELTDEQKTREVEGGKIVIRSKTVSNGTLRIDLTHPPGEPVIVRVSVGGLTERWTLGEHHLFFDTKNANAYTATFDGLSDDDLKMPLTLDFYSISRIRKQAVTDQTKVTVEVKNRPEPGDPSDLLPEETIGK